MTSTREKVLITSLCELGRLIWGHYAREGDFMQQYAREYSDENLAE